MDKKELKKDARYWCWWRSRYIYYLGFTSRNSDGTEVYKFEDIAGVIVSVGESKLKELVKR